MPLERKQVEQSLNAKGFRLDMTHHRMLIYHTAAGVKTAVRTKVSHSGKEIADGLVGQMARQCRVPKRRFEELVECSLDQAGYEAMLVAAGCVKAADAEPEEGETAE